MANISLKRLFEAEDFKAKSKQTGKLVHFKSKDSYDAALKAGTHEDPKAEKDGQPKADTKPNDMFGGDYAKDRGGEAPKADISKASKSKYDDKSYWKDTERERQGQGADDDWDDDDSWGEGPQLTSDRLNKIEDALEDELDLRGNGFETTRESGGGMGGWEGPMQIMDKNADFDDEDNYITLSVGSSNNDGKMSIVFANYNGEPYFEPDYDALTGDSDLEPQQAYKVTKALMKMPEVQKLLKGEMSKEEFQPIYDKLKAKFSKGKTESTKLTSMIRKTNENKIKNISLKVLLEAEDFKAKSKQTGKLVHFKSKDAYQAALKAGTHEDPKAKKGEQPKAAAKPHDMFGGDYAKDRGGKTPTSKTAHVSVKPDSEEVQTIAKLTGVREKFIAGYINKHKLDAAALANFAKKGPLQNRLSVGRAMIGEPGNKSEKELIKKFRVGKSELTATSLPKKASQLSDKHANLVADTLNKETGLDGFAEIDDNSGAITFIASPGNEPTYTLFIGSNQKNGKPNQFRVTLEPTARQDPGGFRNKIDKSFETAEEAMAFAVKIAKKYKSELQLDDNIRFSSDYNMYDDEDADWTSDKKTESTKLTSMIKK
jgi:hypothetical protein